MRHAWMKCLLLGAPAAVVLGCATYPDAGETRASAEKMVQESFSAPQPALLKRLEQDRAQALCSTIGDAKLTQQEAAEPRPRRT